MKYWKVFILISQKTVKGRQTRLYSLHTRCFQKLKLQYWCQNDQVLHVYAWGEICWRRTGNHVGEIEATLFDHMYIRAMKSILLWLLRNELLLENVERQYSDYNWETRNNFHSTALFQRFITPTIHIIQIIKTLCFCHLTHL